MLQTIESDTPFDVASVDFLEPGNIPDQDEYLNITTLLDFMTGFGIG